MRLRGIFSFDTNTAALPLSRSLCAYRQAGVTTNTSSSQENAQIAHFISNSSTSLTHTSPSAPQSQATMATAATMNASSQQAVLDALATMAQSNVADSQKGRAHSYLEQFQKSTEAWESTFTMLSSPQSTDEAKLFAATTLKGKVG